MIVLDGSAAVEYLTGTAPRGAWVEERLLADPDIHSPHLLDVEVPNALRGLVERRVISASAARHAVADLGDLDVTRYPHLPLLDRIWALHHNLSAYDAAYVALAEALGAVLVTTDGRAARAPGVRARIEAFPE